jgi:hypothetical protein
MTEDETKAMRATRIAFLNCNDAALHVADVKLTEEERARVRAALAWLEHSGIVLVPRQHQGAAVRTYDVLLATLQASVGDLAFQAALGAEPREPMGEQAAPCAVMTVWKLEPEGDDVEDRDVLLGSGRLWGIDLLIEALRVEEPDDPLPAKTVRPRLERWVKAAGGGSLRKACRPPGEDGWYAVAAISSPI